MSRNKSWEKLYKKRDWGEYHSEELINKSSKNINIKNNFFKYRY